jgi:hypothetical protein
MIDIPKDVEKYLVKDEIVDNKFDLNDYFVFTSTFRMFIKGTYTVRDIAYSHISSLELQTKRKWLLIVICIVLIATTFYLRQQDPVSWLSGISFGRLLYGYGSDGSLGGWFYYVLGAVLIIVGYRWKTPSIKFRVAGLTGEQVLSGKKDTVDALFRLLNERRFNPSNKVEH